MDFFTHLLIAVLISVLTLNSMPFSIVLYACIMAILADFDIILEPLRKVIKSNLLAHKGISHSIFYAALVSALTGGFFSLITKESFFLAWLIGFAYYDLHILLDFLTASKIPLFYPLTKKRYRFFIDRAINFSLALISAGIVMFYIVTFFFWQEIVFSGLIYYIVGFYLVYFIIRITIKIVIKINYPNNHKFIPGISPFSYLIYVRTEKGDYLHFKLIFKSLFKHNSQLVLESIIVGNSHNKELLSKSSDLIKNFPFGEKWIYFVPIFEENENSTTLDFVFAESYFKGHSYSIKIVFDNVTHEILELSDGFNRK